MAKALLLKGLSTEMRDTIMAERLSAPVILREIQDAREEERKEIIFVILCLNPLWTRNNG